VDLGVLVGGVAGRLGRTVDEVQDAGLEGLGRDQLQRDRGLALVEQLQAFANSDRVNQQVQLVQQTGGQQLADGRDRAAQPDVAARLVLQGGHSLDEVALELFGVPPGELELLNRPADLLDRSAALEVAAKVPVIAGHLATDGELRDRP
jgi:hypothetical protein